MYLRNFRSFLDRWGWTPEELHEARRVDMDPEDSRDQKNVERKVRVYMNELQEEGKAPRAHSLVLAVLH